MRSVVEKSYCLASLSHIRGSTEAQLADAKHYALQIHTHTASTSLDLCLHIISYGSSHGQPYKPPLPVLLHLDISIMRPAPLASVGLRVSVSHDLGEIACEICMQFDDAICRYAICGYAICALVRQEMRQSARAINVWISHRWMRVYAA